MLTKDRAWELIKNTKLTEHQAGCNYRLSKRQLLCDCCFLIEHDENKGIEDE